MNVLRWAVTLWLAALLSGVSGLAIYSAVFTRPTRETGWVGWVVYRTGQALVVVAVVVIGGGILAAAIAGGLAAFQR